MKTKYFQKLIITLIIYKNKVLPKLLLTYTLSFIFLHNAGLFLTNPLPRVIVLLKYPYLFFHYHISFINHRVIFVIFNPKSCFSDNTVTPRSLSLFFSSFLPYFIFSHSLPFLLTLKVRFKKNWIHLHLSLPNNNHFFLFSDYVLMILFISL